MRVVHLSSSSRIGGADVAAFRLHRALRTAGIDSKMLVGRALPDDDEHVIPLFEGVMEKWMGVRRRIDALHVRLRAGSRVEQWSAPVMPILIGRSLRKLAPDVVNLHWVTGGFLSVGAIQSVASGRAAVWTMHDMWGLTGGCHYAYECRRFERECGSCPQLHSTNDHDLSQSEMARKRRAFSAIAVHVVTPSRWLFEQVRSSSLWRESPGSTIPYGIDLESFKPVDRAAARQNLGIPEKAPCVLFGALSATADPRKGYDLLQEALRHAAGPLRKAGARLLIFGGEPAGSRVDEETGLQVHHLGTIRDQRALVCAYSCADVFVAPSRADNLPSTVIEAAACGTATIAFDVGGMREIIAHGKTGFLVPALDTKAMGDRITAALCSETSTEMGRAARARVETEFSSLVQAQRYAALYESLQPRLHSPSS